MGFDASKLIVGKKYPTRDGGKVEFVRAWRWSTIGEVQLIWLSCFGDEYGQCYTSDASGRQMTVTKAECGMDIISDEPIKEPVEMKAKTPWVAVFWDGSTSIGFDSKERAMAYMHQQVALGVAELPATLLVFETPR